MNKTKCPSRLTVDQVDQAAKFLTDSKVGRFSWVSSFLHLVGILVYLLVRKFVQEKQSQYEQQKYQSQVRDSREKDLDNLFSELKEQQ